MESGSKKMNSPEKVKDQILRMESYNRKDRVLAAHDQGTNVGVNQQGASRASDWKQGACFKCHLPGHCFNECPSKDEKDENDEKDLEVLEDQQ
ncbi:hypothetical protein PF002_g3072 [Phytophthora fragariae]|nr:hypothetical protein PF003_g1437 [Phytophthora fragariae]KAE9003043.1 hypothetical protein PF011_g13060 [Phytophthora fragariae]KAE9103598.1 hypothetical protein PF007_g14355 [Phytophthora fragariae]KAE9221490.1 hypothetical protein PF004_g13037 [Phytophthora fragariae]KAE9254023.1 hypothetical protein PF002_g3072 [Phytophthora fragariae]